MKMETTISKVYDIPSWLQVSFVLILPSPDHTGELDKYVQYAVFHFFFLWDLPATWSWP